MTPTLKNPKGSVIVSLLATAAVVGVLTQSALPQAVHLVVVNIPDLAQGYRTSKLLGSSVVNDQNDKIGTIDDIIIGKDRVLFAVLQVGGFLGLGGHSVAVPYRTLVLDPPGGKVTLPGATKDELKKLPEFKYA